jgi:hypothetical protein
MQTLNGHRHGHFTGSCCGMCEFDDVEVNPGRLDGDGIVRNEVRVPSRG